MGLNSITSALALTIGEKGRRLSLDGSQPLAESAWARFEALELDAGRETSSHATNGHHGAIDHLKTRRLALRTAILATDPARLQSSLRACVPEGSGFSELRVWFASGAPWLGGRITIGHREAPFTIRLALEPRATGPRQLALFLGDVRLYAPLPLPAPLVGSALARAIVAGSGGPSARLAVRDGALDVAPLELALVSALVARGWRLPDLAPAPLRAVTASEDAPAWRLSFGGDGPATEQAAPSGSGSWLEGQRLPDALARAEHALFAGDVRAAEDAYRAHLASQPEERAAQARLVALAAPLGTDVLDAGARALAHAWPDFLPGWLYAALGAWQAGQPEAAAACFTRASALAAARGENEDARLAAAAAAAVRNDSPSPATAARAVPAPSTAVIARALISGDRASAEAAVAGHLQDHEDPTRRGSLHAEIAEAVLAAGGGVALALSTVVEVSLAGSSDRGLELRAELAERQGNTVEAARALGELSTRAAAAGDLARARILSERQARLVSRSVTMTRLEKPSSLSVPISETGEAVYATEKETQAGPQALTDLLRGFDQLSPERQRAAYASFDGEPASDGDLAPPEPEQPDDSDALPHQELVHRRALLASNAGDDATAEAGFQELASLEPLRVEPRLALADLAIQRGDRVTGVQRLEEVLRLLPLDAPDATLEVRGRLGELHADLGNWDEARRYQELILAQHGDRPAALDRLVEALLHLEQFEEAAAACERLSRLYDEPARRAEALYRQGEILLGRLHDEPRAFDAFLKSSDLAPVLVPTALRLVSGFWKRGRFAEVAEVAGDLAHVGALPRTPLGVRIRAALAAAIAGYQPAPISPAGIDDAREQPREVARALAEAARHLGTAAPACLEPAVKLITAPGGSDARAALAAVTSALAAAVNDDPAAAEGGAALALGWLADRRGEPVLARPYYALAAFLDGGAGVAARLEQLGPCPAATTASLALAGGNDHPGVGGTAAPLRRALGALAHGLAGFGPLSTPPLPQTELAIALRDAWYALAKTMTAPPLDLRVADGAAGEQASEVTALGSRPGLIALPTSMADLPDEESTFWVARAFDRLRNGLALVDGVTSGDAREVEALLRGAAATLAGRTPPDLPLATAVAAELGSPERVAELVGAAPRPRVAGDLLLAEEALAGWGKFRAAAELASDRFALLACRSPLAALRALYRHYENHELSPDVAREPAGEPARRLAFLRTHRSRELATFMTSAIYADATRDPGA